MTPKNIAVEPDVLEALKQRAEAEGISVDEAANEAIQVGLQEASWAAFITKGRKYGRGRQATSQKTLRRSARIGEMSTGDRCFTLPQIRTSSFLHSTSAGTLNV